MGQALDEARRAAVRDELDHCLFGWPGLATYFGARI
jgi:hypothetical protein